ncbi:MAG TPA: phage morphogenesis protein, partial [Bacteroidales bacterium]|nr:phage morphogenesis protein [Bacteroidales bacterium]
MGIFNTIKKNILSDIKVELTEEFDRNFERKGFFSNRWSDRKRQNIGSLMQATGTLRKSIRSKVQ